MSVPSRFFLNPRCLKAEAMNKHLAVETGNAFGSLLELAADDDAAGFRRWLDRDPAAADEAGLWYGRGKVLEHRTPLMVAATYGSLAVLDLLLSLPSVDINRRCGPDGGTALHCAAGSGSPASADAVKRLISAGADVSALDAAGRRPADVIVAPPNSSGLLIALQKLLLGSSSPSTLALRVNTSSSNSDSASLSSSEGGSPSSDSTSSPRPPATDKLADGRPPSVPEKKEYPVDPSLPDLRNSVYASDEFRMYSFKVRPCSRAYSHDWTECPFVHPGENARRRDPRKYHYSCVPCPDFRKGTCQRGDLCEYAHGVFECWLHPSQYRTRLCKDSTSCNRRVCFFAHANEELRPVYVSAGLAVPSPRSASVLDMAAAMGLMPGSPSSASPFTPPLSPSANGIGHSSLGWPQLNVPALHLPGSNLQLSRLRTSLCARDMPVDNLSILPDLDAQMLNDACFSHLSLPAGVRSTRGKTLIPSNLDDLFSSEMALSPRYSSDQGAMFSPTHKTAVLNQFQQQQQSLLSPINTSLFSPKAVETQQLPGQYSLFQSSLGVSSPGQMSPRPMEPVSPVGSRLAALAQREKLRSLSSRELDSGCGSFVVGSPVGSPWSKFESPLGAPDWGVNREELGRLRRSSSFELRSGNEEPDLSWVHSLVKDSTPEKLASIASNVAPPPIPEVVEGSNMNANSQMEGNVESEVLGAWLDQLQIDQMKV